MSDLRRRLYVSYLLRLWQTQHKGALVWRASLESANTGERWGFASLAELYTFLEEESAAGIENGRQCHGRCDQDVSDDVGQRCT